MSDSPSPSDANGEVAVQLIDPTFGRPLKSWTFPNRAQITIGRVAGSGRRDQRSVCFAEPRQIGLSRWPVGLGLARTQRRGCREPIDCGTSRQRRRQFSPGDGRADDAISHDRRRRPRFGRRFPSIRCPVRCFNSTSAGCKTRSTRLPTATISRICSSGPSRCAASGNPTGEAFATCRCRHIQLSESSGEIPTWPKSSRPILSAAAQESPTRPPTWRC